MIETEPAYDAEGTMHNLDRLNRRSEWRIAGGVSRFEASEIKVVHAAAAPSHEIERPLPHSDEAYSGRRRKRFLARSDDDVDPPAVHVELLRSERGYRIDDHHWPLPHEPRE